MREPTGADPLHDLLDAALGLDGADEVEARAVHTWGGLARFADSAIHQHVAGDDTSVSVRVNSGGRVGAASTNDATSAGVATAATRALAAARLSPPDPRYPGLAGPATLAEEPGRYDEATAATSPRQRAMAVAALLATLGPGQQAAGAVSTTAAEVAFATTAGARLYALSTRASASAVVTGDGATGHGEDAARALEKVDVAGVGERAAATAAAAVDPIDIQPGDLDLPADRGVAAPHLHALDPQGFGPMRGDRGEHPRADAQAACDLVRFQRRRPLTEKWTLSSIVARAELRRDPPTE